ncbi:Calmodulin-regulated spectrin-associated protein 1 [Allomyces arbusculus]|nr:Calmodulin-regulated spectrin-associated protein 1 [Allomyces arbusculus]
MSATGPRTVIAADDAQSWLSTIIDSPVTAEDCRDGFIFVQLLGIMDPAAIDVTSHIGSGAACMDYWKILEDAVARSQRLDTPDRTELGSTVSKTRDAATVMVANPCQWSEEFSALTARFRNLMREHHILISDAAGPDRGAPQAAEDNAPSATGSAGLPMLALDRPRSDPNFDLCVLHLLFLCRDDVHPQSQVASELSTLIANQIKQESLSLEHARALSQGYIYALVAQHLGVDGVDCPVVSSVGQEPPTRAIEQTLPQLKALDGEAYHLTILTHLLDRRVQQLSKSAFTSLDSHLRTLPGFEEGPHTPFDLEDALLIWLTLLQPCTNPEAEFSDLFVDVAQPGVWTAILHKVLGGPGATHAALLAEANELCAILPPKSHSRTGKLLVVLSLVRLFERALARSSSAKRIRLKKAKLQRVDPMERGRDSATSLASARQTGSAASASSTATADRITSRSASSAQIALAAEFELRTKPATPSDLDPSGPSTTLSASRYATPSPTRLATDHCNGASGDEAEPEVELELEPELPSMSSFHAVSPVPQPLPHHSDGEPGHDGFDLDAYLVHPVASPEPPTKGFDAGPAVDEDFEPAFMGQSDEMDAAAAGNDLIRDLEVFVDDLLDCYDGSDGDEDADFDGDDGADVLAHQLAVSGLGHDFFNVENRDAPTSSLMLRAPPVAQETTRLSVTAVPINPSYETKVPRPTWAGRASTSFAGSSVGPRTATPLAVAAANGAVEPVGRVPATSTTTPAAPTPPPAQPSRPTTASTTLLFHNDDFDPERAKKRINRLRQRLATPTSAGGSARASSRPTSALSDQGSAAATATPSIAEERVELPVQAPEPSIQAAFKASSATTSEPLTPRTGGAAAKIKEQQRKIMSERNLGKAKKSTNIIDRNVKNSSASRRSNKKLIVNALNMCLSGPVNEKTRTEVLEDLERSDQTNFVVLLRGPKNHSFKGLYVHVVDQNQIIKLYGNGPLEIEQADVSEFFKYDSGSRSFKPIPTRSFSTFVHGVAMQATVKH